MDDHSVHLALLALLLFHHNALQDALQVGETVLMLQIGCGPNNGMHQRQVFHPQLEKGNTWTEL